MLKEEKSLLLKLWKFKGLKKAFQERLRKLSPLPYLLEETKLKLQEALSQKQMAERTAETIAAEFEEFKEHAKAIAEDARRVRNCQQQMSAKQMSDQQVTDELRAENIRLSEELAVYKAAADTNCKK
ncbi:uncharacterized protein LOC113366171 [Ctenocephalides felis]|uniref:uncharacterized protein LOC113366171 n=1 Tax=Ctenocephalides felis TaxID=7515 RepID=UPI000E6E136D|nr:uncharacterized protein LOC113366171 [Ctenocephalides felis]